MKTFQFLIQCLMAMFSLWLVCQLALWVGPHVFWFEPAILFIRNVGLVIIGALAFAVLAVTAIRSVTGEGR